MDQHRAFAISSNVNKCKSLVKILFDVLRSVVGSQKLFVSDLVRLVIGGLGCGHIEDVVNAQSGQGVRVRGVSHVAKEEEGGHLGRRVVLDILGSWNVGRRGRRGEAGDVERTARAAR